VLHRLQAQHQLALILPAIIAQASRHTVAVLSAYDVSALWQYFTSSYCTDYSVYTQIKTLWGIVVSTRRRQQLLVLQNRHILLTTEVTQQKLSRILVSATDLRPSLR
jgi:hypothetical protein